MGLDEFMAGSAFGAAGGRARHADVEALRRANRRSVRNRANANKALQGDVSTLRAEVEYLSLVLTSLIAQLDAKGVVTRDDLRSLMVAADDFDGQVDGRLPVSVLDELLRGDQGEQNAAGETPGDSPAEPTLQ
jgi:hypothetical protein